MRIFVFCLVLVWAAPALAQQYRLHCKPHPWRYGVTQCYHVPSYAHPPLPALGINPPNVLGAAERAARAEQLRLQNKLLRRQLERERQREGAPTR